jgi:hypothetical protein
MHTAAVGASRELVRTPPEVRQWEEDLGLTLEDVDLVYMYPWPGEGHFIETLFDAVAPEGALLVTYQEPDEMQVQRRVSAEDPDEDLDDEFDH